MTDKDRYFRRADRWHILYHAARAAIFGLGIYPLLRGLEKKGLSHPHATSASAL